MATKSYKVTNLVIAVLEGRTLIATWKFTKPSDFKEYKVVWEYKVNGISNLVIGSSGNTTDKQSQYTIPDNSKITSVKVTVKPVPTDTKKWTGTSVDTKFTLKTSLIPDTPPAPTASLTETTGNVSMKLILEINGVNKTGANNSRVDKVDFQLWQSSGDDIEKKYVKDSIITATVDGTGHARIKTDSLGYSRYYKVRARVYYSKESDLKSDWSEYSESTETRPDAPARIERVTVLSTAEDAVRVEIAPVATAKQYQVEYATDEKYFTNSEGQVQSQTSPNERVIITGLAKAGKEYVFRARVANSSGAWSAWSPTYRQTFGVKANPPTTWTSDTSAILGETVGLYWLHNSADGSEPIQHVITLELTSPSGYPIDQKTVTFGKEFLKDEATKYYDFDTSQYSEDFILSWYVQTAGATGELSDISTIRQVNVYQQPTLTITTSSTDQNGVLNQLPLVIEGFAGPSSQRAVTYLLEVIANNSYEDVDYLGNPIWINQGDAVYSNVIVADGNTFQISLGPSNINLANGQSYEIKCVVAMNVGLKALSNTLDFEVSWDESMPTPQCGYYIIDEDYSIGLIPYCKDDDDEYIPNILMSVYRINHDGTFVEIGSELDNENPTAVIDPHPALNYARYRVVATSTTTGAISFFDIDSIEMKIPSIIIQWNETFQNRIAFVTDDGDVSNSASGTLLKLDWNIDINNTNEADVALVEYIGRQSPVSYYGTQRKESTTWNCSIPVTDLDSLYKIRALARYAGDVYVREPSGIGYWANIKVNYSSKHDVPAIPVTFTITRVEGGM